jgi:hypothetical protein
LANQSLLDVSAGGGFVVKELRWPTSWDAIEMRGVLEAGQRASLRSGSLTIVNWTRYPLERRVGCDPGSTPLCRAATSKPLSTIDSVASCVPGAPPVKLAGAV